MFYGSTFYLRHSVYHYNEPYRHDVGITGNMAAEKHW